MFGLVLEGLNSDGWRVSAYLFVAVLAGFAGRRERSESATEFSPESPDGGNVGLLPAFWFSTSILIASLAAAQAIGLGRTVTAYARRGAYIDGWYQARRSIQAIAICVVVLIWALATLLAIWRIPELRRRYLPMTIVSSSIVGYSAIRLVSLHQVDVLLNRLDVAGLRAGTAIEFVLLAIGALVIWRTLRQTPHVEQRPRRTVGDTA